MRLTDPIRQYLLRTVRIGLQATALVLGALALYPLLPRQVDFGLLPYFATLSAAAAGAAGVALLPWRRLLQGSGTAAIWCFYTWSVADVVLISVLIRITGGPASPFFIVYALTTVFLAASYPPRGQALLMLFTAVAYLVAVTSSPVPVAAGEVWVCLAGLAALAFLSSFLSHELRSAQRESEHRANLLSVVAQSGRAMSSLDIDVVMETVVHCALALGFEAASLNRFDPEAGTHTVLHDANLPPDYLRSSHPITQGMPGLVWKTRATVVTDDYATEPTAAPAMKAQGIRAAIASPVLSQGEMVAVLVAGTPRRRRVSDEEREAFELLAAQAGAALDNAQRFEAERTARERLAELDKLKSDFVSTVSHELRTPLTVIRGMGRTLEVRWAMLPEETRREFIERITVNATVLDGIIARLLDFSRLESGRLELRPQPFDLFAMVAATIDRISDLLARHHIAVEIPAGLTVSADAALLDRVLENLVNNAVIHTPPGTSICIATTVDGDHAVVSVSDNGPGISADDLPHLGERFYRGGDTHTRETRGTGLGLALVRQVVELHGSHLGIESQPGQGATFRFSLPLAPSQILAASKTASPDWGPASRRPA